MTSEKIKIIWIISHKIKIGWMVILKINIVWVINHKIKMLGVINHKIKILWVISDKIKTIGVINHKIKMGWVIGDKIKIVWVIGHKIKSLLFPHHNKLDSARPYKPAAPQLATSVIQMSVSGPLLSKFRNIVAPKYILCFAQGSWHPLY